VLQIKEGSLDPWVWVLYKMQQSNQNNDTRINFCQVTVAEFCTSVQEINVTLSLLVAPSPQFLLAHGIHVA
jgi:hypothetical protein